MNSKLFSIIVPVYNAQDYLCRCLESIGNQTFTDIEIILVNDGSTDKSGDICDAYAKKDSRIIVIHKVNGGQGEARNTGMKKASGEFIIFVDNDDYIDLKTCEVFKDIVSSHQDIDIIVGNNHFIKADRTLMWKNTLTEQSPVITNLEFFKLQLPNNTFWVSPWRNVYRTEFLLSNNLFFKNLFLEDQEWTPRVFLAANLVYVSDFVHYYHICRKESPSQAQSKKINNWICTAEACIENEPLVYKVKDDETRSLLVRYLLFERYFKMAQTNKLYKKPYRKHINNDFLIRNAQTTAEKREVRIYLFSPYLYRFIKKQQNSIKKRVNR